MEWFILGLQASLSESQRIYMQQILEEVANEYIADLEDPEFRDWVAAEVLVRP